MIGTIKLIYQKTEISPFEIIYAKSFISAFVLFIVILVKGIYILDVEP
jgi:hypothetical protein